MIAAGAIAAASAAIALAVVRGLLPRRRLPWLRVVFAVLAGSSLAIGGVATGVALLSVVSAVAVTVWSTYRRHGTAAWTGAPHQEEGSVAHDPQLHRNGVRRARRRRDPMAAEVEALKPELLAVLRPHGVVRVDVVGGYGGPIVVSLGTETDAQLEAIGARDPLAHQVRAYLTAHGVADGAAVRTAGLSKESVERDLRHPRNLARGGGCRRWERRP